jgi:hypothetical protein
MTSRLRTLVGHCGVDAQRITLPIASTCARLLGSIRITKASLRTVATVPRWRRGAAGRGTMDRRFRIALISCASLAIVSALVIASSPATAEGGAGGRGGGLGGGGGLVEGSAPLAATGPRGGHVTMVAVVAVAAVPVARRAGVAAAEVTIHVPFLVERPARRVGRPASPVLRRPLSDRAQEVAAVEQEAPMVS